MPMYLQLDPKQGNQSFGPFEGTVTLGTHPAQCQVVINAPGIQPVHAQVWVTGPGQFGVQPVERGLGLFVMPKGRHDPAPISSATALTTGDVFILGAATGPRFTLLDQAPYVAPTSTVGRATASAKQSAYGQAMSREIERQVTSRLLAKNPMFREAYHAWYRWRSGAMLSPRVIVPALFGAFGLLATVFVTCSGLVLAVLSRFF